jgi:hypothetical protein
MTDPFTREHSLIVTSCFQSQSGHSPLPADLNWSYILEVSVRHGVAPLLYDALREVKTIPQTVRRGLEAHYYGTASKNLLLLREAGAVVGRLEQSGIRAIPVKGASLAERVYPNLALRPFEDIDLLIAKNDFSRAREVLRDMAYQSPAYLLPDRFYLDHHFHLPLIKEKPTKVYLELHWGFTDRFMLFTPDMGAVFARASKVLAPEDELIYLAMHLEKHGYLNQLLFKKGQKEGAVGFLFNPLSGNRLIWFMDLRLILKSFKDRLNWQDILKRCDQWGVRESLGSALFLLKTLGLDGDLSPVTTPQSRSLTLTERLLQGAALGGKNSTFLDPLLKMDSKTQFRPIRILDLFRYISPPTGYLKRQYHYRSFLATPFYRGYHALRCLYRDLFQVTAVMLVVLTKKFFRKTGRVAS